MQLKQQAYIYLLIAVVLYLPIFELAVSFKIWTIAKIGVVFYFTSFFLIYPLFYLYIRGLIYPESINTSSYYIYHLILPLIVLIFTTVTFFLLGNSGARQLYEVSYLFHSENEIINIYRIILFTLYYAQFIVYLVMIFKLAEESKALFIQKYFYAKWVYAFIVTAVFYELVLIVAALFLEGEDLLIIEQSLGLVFVLFAGFIGFNQWIIELRLKIEKIDFLNGSGESKHINTRLSQKEQNEIREQIEKFIHIKNVFVDPGLKIETFAKRIHIPSKKLSCVINELYGMNFNKFINSLRIAAATSILNNSHNNTKLEEIYLEVGFISRSTFNRAFKDFTGSTPSEYLSNYRKTHIHV